MYSYYERGVISIVADFEELVVIEGVTALYTHLHQEGQKQGIKTIADLGKGPPKNKFTVWGNEAEL